ncbi:MAG: DUF3168 domain-containing protein [Pseudomonadota bacterium]
MADAMWAVQTAIYAALNGVISCPVYDNVQASAALPYVVIGEDTQIPDDTKTNVGFDVTHTLHVWADGAAGRKTAKQILGQIYDVLHDGNLTSAGFDFVNCRLEYSDTDRDEDDAITHGVARYRISVDRVA